MARSAQHAVMGVGRIEMAACRFERGRVAFADGVEVEGVLARRQSFEGKLEQDARRSLRQRDRSDVLPVRILERGVRRLRYSRDSQAHRQYGCRANTCEVLEFHHNRPPAERFALKTSPVAAGSHVHGTRVHSRAASLMAAGAPEPKTE